MKRYTRTSRGCEGERGMEVLYTFRRVDRLASQNPPLCKLVWHSASEECNKGEGQRGSRVEIMIPIHCHAQPRRRCDFSQGWDLTANLISRRKNGMESSLGLALANNKNIARKICILPQTCVPLPLLRFLQKQLLIRAYARSAIFSIRSVQKYMHESKRAA